MEAAGPGTGKARLNVPHLVTLVYGMYGDVGACNELKHIILVEASNWPWLGRRH